jgi:hypothetical protein
VAIQENKYCPPKRRNGPWTPQDHAKSRRFSPEDVTSKIVLLLWVREELFWPSFVTFGINVESISEGETARHLFQPCLMRSILHFATNNLSPVSISDARSFLFQRIYDFVHKYRIANRRTSNRRFNGHPIFQIEGCKDNDVPFTSSLSSSPSKQSCLAHSIPCAIGNKWYDTADLEI